MQDTETPDQCTATARSTGERCQNPPIKGSNVCRMHGGQAPQVQKKAQERLDEMADSTTAEMQAIIDDLVDLYEQAPPEDKVDIAREIRQNWVKILDRTGHGSEENHNIDADVKHDLGDGWEFTDE